MWIGITLLVILLAVGVGIGAYHAGQTNGLEQTGRSVEVVRVIGHGWGFGFLFFPFFFIGLFVLFRLAFFRRWGGHHHGHHGPWSGEAPPMFEDWHRRQHEEGGAKPHGPEASGSA